MNFNWKFCFHFQLLSIFFCTSISDKRTKQSQNTQIIPQTAAVENLWAFFNLLDEIKKESLYTLHCCTEEKDRILCAIGISKNGWNSKERKTGKNTIKKETSLNLKSWSKKNVYLDNNKKGTEQEKARSSEKKI